MVDIVHVNMGHCPCISRAEYYILGVYSAEDPHTLKSGKMLLLINTGNYKTHIKPWNGKTRSGSPLFYKERVYNVENESSSGTL